MRAFRRRENSISLRRLSPTPSWQPERLRNWAWEWLQLGLLVKVKFIQVDTRPSFLLRASGKVQMAGPASAQAKDDFVGYTGITVCHPTLPHLLRRSRCSRAQMDE
jgi:hypothetical protein